MICGRPRWVPVSHTQSGVWLCWCLSLVKGLCVSHSAGASGVPEGKSAARWLLSSASALTLRHLVTKITSSRGQIRFSPKFSVFARNWTSVRSVRSGPRSCRPRVFLERDPLLSPPLLRVTAPYVVDFDGYHHRSRELHNF